MVVEKGSVILDYIWHVLLKTSDCLLIVLLLILVYHRCGRSFRSVIVTFTFLFFSVEAHHYFQVAQCDENFTDVERYLASHRLHGKPGQIRKLDQVVCGEAEAENDDEGRERQVQLALHPLKHVLEARFEQADEDYEKWEERDKDQTIRGRHHPNQCSANEKIAKLVR